MLSIGLDTSDRFAPSPPPPLPHAWPHLSTILGLFQQKQALLRVELHALAALEPTQPAR